MYIKVSSGASKAGWRARCIPEPWRATCGLLSGKAGAWKDFLTGSVESKPRRAVSRDVVRPFLFKGKCEAGFTFDRNIAARTDVL